MNRPRFVITAVVATAFSAACRGPNPDELPDMVGVEGCLTASGDELVLTRLTPAAPGPQADQDGAATGGPLPAQQATQMFTLTGMEDELRPHIGREVRVRGEAQTPEVAVLRQHQLPAPTGTAAPPASGAQDTTDGAQVTTMRQTRLETTELTVRSVTPLNRNCQVP